MTDTGRVSEAASRSAGVAGNALLVILATVAAVVGAPFYLLARVAAMFHNLSVGLPANYGFKRRAR